MLVKMPVYYLAFQTSIIHLIKVQYSLSFFVVCRERARRMQERLDEINKEERVFKEEMKRAIKKEGDLSIFNSTFRRF